MTGEFLTSSEWKELSDYLRKRREGFVHTCLTHSDHDTVLRAQSHINELDYLLVLPSELHRRKQNADG